MSLLKAKQWKVVESHYFSLWLIFRCFLLALYIKMILVPTSFPHSCCIGVFVSWRKEHSWATIIEYILTLIAFSCPLWMLIQWSYCWISVKISDLPLLFLSINYSFSLVCLYSPYKFSITILFIVDHINVCLYMDIIWLMCLFKIWGHFI